MPTTTKSVRIFTALTALALFTGMDAMAQDEPDLATNAPATAQDAESLRTFLLIGEPNAAAWEFLIEDPQDREGLMAEPIERLGGQMLGYYWGLGDGRNYILVALPDDPALIQATYVGRLGEDLLVSYQMIELMTGSAMVEALTQVAEVRRIERGGR